MAVMRNFESRDTYVAAKRNARALESTQDDVSTLQADVTAAETAITGLDSPAGTATITTGNTSITVTHNWGASTYVVSVVPQADLGAGIRYWVSSKGDNNFDVNISTAPGTNRVFEWILRSTA